MIATVLKTAGRVKAFRGFESYILGHAAIVQRLVRMSDTHLIAVRVCVAVP